MSIILVGAFMLGSVAAPAPTSTLTLSATAVRASYRHDEPQLIRVTLENTADPSVIDFSNPVFSVVVPWLTFGRPLSGWPYLQVAFEITDPDGVTLARIDDGFFQKLVPADPSWFRELHAGQFFGNVVDLRVLGFRCEKRGRYSLRAHLSSDARVWVDSWLKKHARERLLFSYDHVFGGKIDSEATSFMIE